MSEPTDHKYNTKDYIVKETPDKISELRDEIATLSAKLDKIRDILGVDWEDYFIKCDQILKVLEDK